MLNQTYSGDGANVPSPLWPPKKQPRELTGSMVLGLMVAFFAIVFGMNAFMAREAISTVGGVETESSYRAGQTFERDVAMAKAQDAQHWQVNAKVTPAEGGGAVLDIVARDATGAPLTGLLATALFARPTDRRLDRTLAVSESAPGHFRGSADIPAGQWDLVIDLSRRGERVFRSKNRVILR
jgi:nitrogen fixation protein FixH